MLPDRPFHLRLSGSSSLRAQRLRTDGPSRGLPLRNGRSLVPQAPQRPNEQPLNKHADADQEPARPHVRGVRGTPDDDLRPCSHRGVPAGDRLGGASRRHRSRRRGGERHPERVRGASGCCPRLRGGADDGRRPGRGVGGRERVRGHHPRDPRRRRGPRAAGTCRCDRLGMARRVRNRRGDARSCHRRP